MSDVSDDDFIVIEESLIASTTDLSVNNNATALELDHSAKNMNEQLNQTETANTHEYEYISEELDNTIPGDGPTNTVTNEIILENSASPIDRANDNVETHSSNYEYSLLEVNLPKETAKLLPVINQNNQRENGVQNLVNSVQNIQNTSNRNLAIDGSSVDDLVYDLLKRLQLTDFVHKKMDLDNIMEVFSVFVHEDQPNSEADLVRTYFNRLLLLDVRVRHLHYINKTAGQVTHENATADDEFDNFLTWEEKTSSMPTENIISPMELQMAIILCSNQFALQWIYRKLTMCQYSVPLLLSNPFNKHTLTFPMWSLRGIQKNWTEINNLSETRKQVLLPSTKLSVVSVLRIENGPGISSEKNHSFSKSIFLNSIIGKHNHSVFFTRDCPGSTKTRLLSDGVTEIAWYCPGNKRDDAFNQAIAFVNLRGNAFNQMQQVEFIKSISSVLVLQLPDTPLSDAAKLFIKDIVLNPQIPSILLFPNKETSPSSNNDDISFRIGCKGKSRALLQEEMIKRINQCLTNPNLIKVSLDDMYKAAKNCSIKVDEEAEECMLGRTMSSDLIKKLSQIANTKDRKNIVLPMQGKDYWQKWAILNKSIYRLQVINSETLEQQRSKIKEQMEATRISQRNIQRSEFFSDAVEIFFQVDWKGTLIRFFLQWVSLELDKMTSKELARLQKKYSDIWREMQALRHHESEKFVDLQNSLGEVVKEINSSSLSTQHILREIGQLYECLYTAEPEFHIGWPIKKLPNIGAQLLLRGYPLELLDGDASQVPIDWIKAVFTELSCQLKNEKVFVLSVLGLQSSGKSTLLNTMFGLQFAVSSGRCTRGIFMQLLRVNPTISKELGYEFILVVDSEGLRSPELSDSNRYKRDNELATLVIGVGDLTIINIMGENASEMQEVLQICVQAILRMKTAKLRPSVIFVHQNVAETDAQNSNIEGRRRLVENLDKMTQLAAKEVGFVDIQHFSDVIQFNMDTQVFYFKNLFMGDPPMAPPNPSYSLNVKELKEKVLTIKNWLPNFVPYTFSEMQMRISDIWQSLLEENFVFNFRNILEVHVYNNLENAYSSWTWQLRKHTVETAQTLLNKINSKQVEFIDNKNIRANYEKKYLEISNEMDRYFKEESHPEILVQWKENLRLRFQNLCNEQIDEIINAAEKALQVLKQNHEIDNQSAQYSEQLSEASKNLGMKLKGRHMNNQELKDEFEKLWQGFTKKIAVHSPAKGKDSILAEVEKILMDHFQNHPRILSMISTATGHFEFEKEKHLATNWYNKIQKEWGFYGKNKINDLIKNIYDEVRQKVENWRQTELDFDENLIHDMLQCIKKSIIEHNSNTGANPSLKYAFLVDISIAVCIYYVPIFENIRISFLKRNSPLAYFESKKEAYFTNFRNFCKGAASIIVFVDFLAKVIEKSTNIAVQKMVSLNIANELMSNNQALNGNRSKLENHILKELAENEEFSAYERYLRSPKVYFETYLQSIVITFFKDKNKINGLIQSAADEIKRSLFLAATAANDSYALTNSTSDWLSAFCSRIGDKLVIKREDFTTIENEDISDTQHLLNYFKENIVVQGEIPSNITIYTVNLLSKQFEGCWTFCPFCRATCTNTITGHSGDHSVQFHRSKALSGMTYRGTNIFSIDFCSTSVSGDGEFYPDGASNELCKFKEYRKAGPLFKDWSITPDSSELGYWKWFLCRFEKEWEAKHNCEFTGLGKIPDQWRKITKESILKELNC